MKPRAGHASDTATSVSAAANATVAVIAAAAAVAVGAEEQRADASIGLVKQRVEVARNRQSAHGQWNICSITVAPTNDAGEWRVHAR
jgi:hypothetical protein